jgi:S1-C subfamily serine protease
VRKLLASPFVSAVLGGSVTAAALLLTGAVGTGGGRMVIEQRPLSAASVVSPGGRDGGLTASEIYERDAPGVAFIRARTVETSPSPFDVYDAGARDSESTGSGFVVDDDGHILTNAHVIDHATAVTVTLGGDRTRPAEVVGKDEATDLALIKVDPDGLDLRPLELGDSSTVRVGDPTVAIGNPYGFDRTLTTGVVSALQRRITAPGGYTIEDVIQTDAALNPGNSGGPLIDAAGRVIGVNSQVASGDGGSASVGIGFAVPVDTARRVMAALEEDGMVERPWLGIHFVPIDPSLRGLGPGLDERGLLVQAVKPGGPADRAGMVGGDRAVDVSTGSALLVGGDVVTAIDGRPVETTADVARALAGRSPGEVVDVVVRRDGAELTLRVELGNRPAASGDS